MRLTLHHGLGGGARLGLAGLASAALVAGCGSTTDSGGLTSGDRYDAQVSMNALQNSSIPQRLVGLTSTAGLAPAACRVHLESHNPSTFKVYVFWVPFIGPASYSWLDMTITKNAAADKFHLGAAQAVLPGGTQLAGGKVVAPPLSEYDVPLSQYGPRQIARNKAVLKAHAGDTFSKPGADCEVLENGYLRLVPNA